MSKPRRLTTCAVVIAVLALAVALPAAPNASAQQAEEQQTQQMLQRHIESLQHRLDSLSRQVDDLMFFQRVGDIADVDLVSFTGPPPRYQPNPTAQGAGNPLRIRAYVFITKDLHLFRDIPRVMKDSMLLVGAIIMIIGVAMGFTNYMIDEEIPAQLFAFTQEYISNPLMFLVILNLFLIAVGMMMDIFSAIIVVVPLIMPIAAAYGVDQVHLGIIFLTNLEIGYLTPPVGLNLFISSLRFERPILSVIRATLPYIVILLLALILITYIPDLSLWLVKVLGID